MNSNENVTISGSSRREDRPFSDLMDKLDKVITARKEVTCSYHSKSRILKPCRLNNQYGLCSLAGNIFKLGKPSTPLSFYRPVKAINTCQHVTLLAEGQRCKRFAPYRLIAQKGDRYLIAEYNGHPAVSTLSEIHVARSTTAVFRCNDCLYLQEKTLTLSELLRIFDASSNRWMRFLHRSASASRGCRPFNLHTKIR